MTKSVLSPDGNWLWTGEEWVPAPPKSDTIPLKFIDRQMISTVSNQYGVDQNQLINSAQYFDRNKDGILQKNEIQQTVHAITNPPANQITYPYNTQYHSINRLQPAINVLPIAVNNTESKRPTLGLIGCFSILISIIFPYIGESVNGYQIIEIWASFADDGFSWLKSYGLNEGDLEVNPLFIGLLMFFFFPVWSILVAIPSLLGSGSDKVVKHMKSSGTLHLIYSFVMVLCCYTVFEDLIFDIFGIGVWISIIGGLVMLFD